MISTDFVLIFVAGNHFERQYFSIATRFIAQLVAHTKKMSSMNLNQCD